MPLQELLQPASSVRPQPASSPQSGIVYVIVARYREDVSWLQQLPQGVLFHVYQKEALQPHIPAECQTLLPNVGREAHSYLTFLASQDDLTLLPDLLIFTQGDPFEHNRAFLQDVEVLAAHALEHGTENLHFVPLGLWSGGERIIHCDPSGAPHQSKLLPIPTIWRTLFGDKRRLPLWLGFTPGALFAVTRTAICAHDRQWYVRARDESGLCVGIDPIAGHAFERLWHYIFVR
eukprot:CAMPEP_0119326566 /NCGR_PEP_ID=MMETSP1333-20130426/68689_1 /TAXON_ID=418940 /ORGANISM="Scyphosphaera apsteinii, Strain RCC1455" /LENGTH=232 /DNA_ID=CAMNT_0007334901 /DNA_START=458 /DNA_END=1156 /DNA_ORIENTATION=+